MSIDSERIRAKFGDGYTANDRTFKMGIDQRFTRHFAERFRGRQVLETCTGAGFTTLALAREAAHVVTIEINPLHQAQARQNVQKAGLLEKVTFVSGDAFDATILDNSPPFDSAFLDPDWADTDPGHVYRFRQSNTQPPADTLLQRLLQLTPEVALVLPPMLDLCELRGLPAHELQRLFLGQSHELYCLYFGSLAPSFQMTELRK